MKLVQRLSGRWFTEALAICAAVALAGSGPAFGLGRSMADENICDAVEDAMQRDRAVPYDPIDLSCADGIVTLTGTANNILAKRRATRLAETIKGVRAVVNRMKVKPLTDRSGPELEDDVLAALVSDPAADSYEVTAEADSDGHVTLRGTVDSWQEKQLAKKVVMGVKGVTSITNNIEVNYRAERADSEIRPEIMKALQRDALVDERMIDVDVDDGKVKLSGTVGSAAERRQAVWNAWVAGVDEVDDSELKVREHARDEDRRERAYTLKSGDEIREAIKDANAFDPRVESDNVEPSVTGSVVTLRGTVESLKAKHAAAENARNTVGVSRVLNRLKVRPVVQRTNKQLERDVREALSRDPYVDRYKITVNVVDGTAYLAGSVDSYFEKAQAEDVVTRIKGIVDVSNALVVTNPSWPVVYNPYIHDWYVYDYGWHDYDPAYVAKSDEEIKEDIDDELWWSPFVDADQVDVSVEDGVATLNGAVDSWYERHAAVENALEGGAIAVDNNLNVLE
jgi:osmotically-inducible protein OsmY